MSKLIKTRLESPYKQDGTTTNFPIRNKPGTYMIYKNGVLMYVGFSGTNVYAAMYRHFQSWKDRSQFRATYNRDSCKVRVIYTNTAKQAENLETALITKHKPKDNDQKLQTILNFHQREALKEYNKADAAITSDYREAWE
jgi:Uri superfamily endonuclease